MKGRCPNKIRNQPELKRVIGIITEDSVSNKCIERYK